MLHSRLYLRTTLVRQRNFYHVLICWKVAEKFVSGDCDYCWSFSCCPAS